MTASPIKSGDDASGLMATLRESTRTAHRHAEERPFNRALARGILTAAEWVGHLEQSAFVHRALDSRLARVTASQPAWTMLIAGRSRTSDIAADLEFWRANPSARPLPATQHALEVIAAGSDAASLGMLYVLEGSTNGGRFLARSARRALRLPDATTDGIRSLDPYGDDQPARWAAFKTAMDHLEPPPTVLDVVAGAERMFEIVGNIADQIRAA